ncbi:MAG: ClpXP protease specificity-enhancing factor [Candidatus Malihini olakiniferum]
MALSKLSPRRPYLLRAFYDWLLDNQLTPHLLVDVSLPGVMVPMELARDEKIVLNISQRAVDSLELSHNSMRFKARFAGLLRQIHIPMAAVLAIYAHENGVGTMFEPEPAYNNLDNLKESQGKPLIPDILISIVDNKQKDNAIDPNLSNDDLPPTKRDERPSLRVVK